MGIAEKVICINEYKKKKKEKLLDFAFEICLEKVENLYRETKEAENLILILKNEEGSKIIRKLMRHAPKEERQAFMSYIETAERIIANIKAEFSTPVPYKKKLD